MCPFLIDALQIFDGTGFIQATVRAERQQYYLKVDQQKFGNLYLL